MPSYRTDRFKATESDLLVAVFVINEGEKVRDQLRRMRDVTVDLDVIVADGGSIDGSLDAEFLQQVNVTALLTKTGAGKLSAQMRMVFDFALAHGYAGVIVMDGNGKDGVEAIAGFAAKLREGYDHIQGSRFIPGGRAINTPPSRLLGLKLVHAPLISLASGTRQTDTTNGFRGYSSRLLADPEVSVFREVFRTYELHYHLAIESGRLSRFRTLEIPVTRTYPRGAVPTKISPFRGNIHVLGILFKAAFGRYRTKDGERSGS